MRYVDGFVLPVPKKNLAVYKKMARLAAKVWRDHGALEYVECVGEDLAVKMGAGFLKPTKAKAGETVFFSWIGYKSRAHRDAVNKKVMKDPRLSQMMKKGQPMPFDIKRMQYAGFSVFVDA